MMSFIVKINKSSLSGDYCKIITSWISRDLTYSIEIRITEQ